MIKLSVRILVTGAAGSIGAATFHSLKPNHELLGIDNFNDYYSPIYKNERIKFFNLTSLIKDINICEIRELSKLFSEFKPEVVIHLAARPGVRANFNNLNNYIYNNIVGFDNLAKLSIGFNVSKFIFASSSSVYTSNNKTPFTEDDVLYYPKSFYAITKQSNEMMAQYFASEQTKFLGMRFFTVYGPWGRPDMAVLQFLGKSIKGIKPKFTSELTIQRDFTFIDDVTRIIGESINIDFPNNYEVINVGGSSPRTMSDLIKILENLGLHLEFDTHPASNEDIKYTHASVNKLKNMGFTVPDTTLEVGVRKTYEWLIGQSSTVALNAILELNN
jgi:UDP-glucuronate 4-epimerase